MVATQVKIGKIDLANASWMSIDVGMIICEDLSHEIWTILNDTAVDILAMMEWVGRAQSVLSYMLSTGRMCRQQTVCVIEGGICH